MENTINTRPTGMMPLWEPGQSGNPNGRPKGSKNRATVLRELYEITIKGKDLQDVETKLTVEQAIIQSLIRKAIDGDVSAIKEAQDTVYGKMTDKLEAEVKADTNVRNVTNEVLKHVPQEQLESILDTDNN